MELASTTARPDTARQPMSHYVPPHMRNRNRKPCPPLETQTVQPDSGAAGNGDKVPDKPTTAPADDKGARRTKNTKGYHNRHDSLVKADANAKVSNGGPMADEVSRLAREISVGITDRNTEVDDANLGVLNNGPKKSGPRRPPPKHTKSGREAPPVQPTPATTQAPTDPSKAWDTTAANTTAPTKHNSNGWKGGNRKNTQKERQNGRQQSINGFKQGNRTASRSVWELPPQPKTTTHRKSPDSNAWGSPDEGEDAAPAQDWNTPENAVANMLQWDGSMLPPPVDGPAPYRGRHLLQPLVHTWLEKTCVEFPKGIPVVDTCPASKFTTSNTAENAPREILGDVVPRYWLSSTIGIKEEGIPMHQFWRDNCYEPYIREDEPDAKPFWQNWASNAYETQNVLDVPDARMDPEDECYAKYNKDLGSQHKADALIARKNNRHRRIERARAADLAAQAQWTQTQLPPNAHKPSIDITIRCANIDSKADVSQITAIYNHYVDQSVVVQETQHLSQEQMHDRLAVILDNKMPVLVAVQKPKLLHGNARNQSTVEGKIIGFTYVDEFGPQHTMNEFSADLEMFVMPTHTSKGVGRNLLDRTLFCLDPKYLIKGTCDWDGGLQWQFGGGRRLTRSVFCHMPYAVGDRSRLAWVSGWFERFGFDKVGDLPEVGVKLGQSVNVAIFRFKTGINIDPTNPYR